MTHPATTSRTKDVAGVRTSARIVCLLLAMVVLFAAGLPAIALPVAAVLLCESIATVVAYLYSRR